MSDLPSTSDNEDVPTLNNNNNNIQDNIEVHNEMDQQAAADEQKEGDNKIEQGKDDDSSDKVVTDVLLTQPKNDVRQVGVTAESLIKADISRTILFQSDDEDNSSPSAMARFSGYYKIDPRNVEHNRIETCYIDQLYNLSDLVIANPKAAVRAFQNKGPLGLLHLFIPPNFIDSYMRNATKEVLNNKEVSRGRKVILTVTK